MDFGAVFRASLSGFRDQKTLKYLVALFAFTVFANLAVFGVMYFTLGPAAVQQEFSNPLMAQEPDFNPAGVILFFLLLIPLTIILSIVNFYFYGLITIRSLELSGMKPAEFGFNKFARFVLFEVWTTIMAITGWYNKILFAIFAVLMLVLIIGIVTLPILVGGIILLVWIFMFYIPYLVVIVYASTRLSVAHVHFLQNDLPIRIAGRESWTLTHGRALPIFGVLFVFGLISLVLGILVFICSIVISSIMPGIAGPVIFRTIAQGIYSPILIIITYFALTNVYVQLLAEKKAAIPAHAANAHESVHAPPVAPKPPAPATRVPAKPRPATKPQAVRKATRKK